MSRNWSLRSPAHWLAGTVIYCLFATGLAVKIACAAPWMGLKLQPLPDGGVAVVSATGPARAISAGSRLVAIGLVAEGSPLQLTAEDLREEPDMLSDYAALDAYFKRQDQLAKILASDRVLIEWQGPAQHQEKSGQQLADTELLKTIIEPGARPIASLPMLFWFHVLVAVAGCLIASWVWVLRPSDPATTLFWFTGLLCPAFALPPAIYSGREIAIDGGLFSLLSAMNHFSSTLWGAALVGIFLCHPRRLIRVSTLPWLFVVFGAWSLMGLFRVIPSLNWGIRYLLIVELLLAVGFAAIQWRLSRFEPIDRAALRWLILSLLTGSGLFVVTVVATTSLGWLPALPQGYAFGFFLFVYAGIALGLRRYRLFDLDLWAFRMLLWIAGAVAVLAIDALLVIALDWSAAPALGAAVWVGGLVYFPFRQWLWQRIARREPVSLHRLMPQAVQIALEPSTEGLIRRWDALLEQLFEPLELVAVEQAEMQTARLEEDGLTLFIPTCAEVPARRMRYPRKGGRLFSLQEVALVEALRSLVEQARNARDAQARGAQLERERIARDMHDDVGARLLMLMHRAQDSDQAELARAAISDLRTALTSLDGRPVQLPHAFADWRAEAVLRCEASGVILNWHAEPSPASGTAECGVASKILQPRHKALAERILREALTNALKHARPDRVDLDVSVSGNLLHLRVSHRAVAISPSNWQEGRGLTGMRQRLREAGGRLQISELASGDVQVHMVLPLGSETP